MSNKSTGNSLKLHETDTGSSGVQIASLSGRIECMRAHLEKNKHDYSCKRGLLKAVAVRKKFLRYLRRTSKQEYTKVIKTLKITDKKV